MGLPRMRWRVFWDGWHSGAWNMAFDEALLDRMIETGGVAIIRFYGWNEPTVSLGRSQRVWPALQIWMGHIPIVRRPTGGRAILHLPAEITYSVVLSEKELGPDGRSVLRSYRCLNRALKAGLSSLGWTVEEGRGSACEGIRSVDCFQVGASCDLMMEGRKVVGSAALRRRGFLLQQGSLPLGGEVTWGEDVGLSVPLPVRGRGREHILAGFLEGFQSQFGCAWLEGGVDSAVESLAQRRVARYVIEW